MRHEPSGVVTPAPEPPHGGKPLGQGHRTAIRQIMQKAWFVIPDYDAVETGLAQAEDILRELRDGGYALTRDYIEAKSLATVCTIVLREVVENVIRPMQQSPENH